MPLDAPFRLGPFTVDSEGWLTPTLPDGFPGFSVIWRDRVVSLRLVAPPEGAASGWLDLRVMLGRVPSTADAPSQSRAAAIALLHGLPTQLPADCKLGLLADHRVVLEARTALAFPTSASLLVTAVVGLLLELAPYFDVLDEAGVAGAETSCAGTLGSVNTCPG